MSLHLFNESRMPQSPINNLASGQECDSDDTSPNSAILCLEKEREKERYELAYAKKEIRALNDQLQQAEDDSTLLEQKYDSAITALRKATCKINELETLCDKREGEISGLNANLEAASEREGRLKGRLDSCEKENSKLCLEKSLLEEKVSELERDIRKLSDNSLNTQELVAELTLLRSANLDLRRSLVAAREEGHRSFAGIEDDEESPDRMIFDQFDERTGGVNLLQELRMLGSPLTPTCSRSVQFPSWEDIQEGDVEDEAPSQRELPVSHALVQTVHALPSSLSSVSTQTTHSNLGDDAAVVSHHYSVSYQLRGNPAVTFPPPMFPPSPKPNLTHSTWWIWVLAVLFLIFALIRNGYRFDISYIVDTCRNGLKFHYKKSLPPH